MRKVTLLGGKEDIHVLLVQIQRFLFHVGIAQSTTAQDAKGEPAADTNDGVMYVITEVAQYSLKDLIVVAPAMRSRSRART